MFLLLLIIGFFTSRYGVNPSETRAGKQIAYYDNQMTKSSQRVDEIRDRRLKQITEAKERASKNYAGSPTTGCN